MKEQSDIPAASRRIVIMGNGGSGKTWLASRLAEPLGLPLVHLDDVHWEPGRYGIARDRAVVHEDVRAMAAGEAWLIEGVYGLYVNIALPRTTALVWLDLSEDECVANIMRRGIQGGESQSAFDGLVKWVSEYRTRKNNWNSFDAHLKLFESFSGQKARLTSRNEINAFMESFLPMSADQHDWLKAAAQRSHRTADALDVVIEAVERAEMDPNIRRR
ncbi:AAA family ATPase [Neorhizobium galegae]|uniref:AAA family ATPase n=1 Tax=Neorhizobium galegae TaxID=399 RepID=UPI0020351689|nr:AAA family ATPase [Neorhizobium galegae]MCM2501266.1 AAA family ATPase [Neorhizobium galegae]MCQ1770148.1 AAA family ATPase [Neorhizobium galegae]MCQ1796553.1 AAA family ATPase [Neorhizobium galegae]